MECPHCKARDSLEELPEAKRNEVPRSWLHGQVSPTDSIYRCRECRKLCGYDSKLEISCPVGWGELV